MIPKRMRKRYNAMRPRSKKAGAFGMYYPGKGLPFQKTRRHYIKIMVNGLACGHKNLTCPYYEDCLTAACKKNIIWICNGCTHEDNHDGELLRVLDRGYPCDQ